MRVYEQTAVCRLLGAYGWQDGHLYDSGMLTVRAGDCASEGRRRVYLRFEMPELPAGMQVCRAELCLFQTEGADGGGVKLGVYCASGGLHVGACTPSCAHLPLDYSNPRSGACAHRFDVTALFARRGRTARAYTLALRMTDETGSDGSYAVLHGLSGAQYAPILSVVYEKKAAARAAARKSGGSCNLLGGHGFERLADLRFWEAQYACDDFEVGIREAGALFGRGAAVFRSQNDTTIESGLCQTVCVPASGSYVFSAYVRPLGADGPASGVHGISPGIYLQVTCGGLVRARSRAVAAPGGYVRLWISFEARIYERVRVEILMNGFGCAAVDGAQLEYGSRPGAYNLLENGGFERGLSGWTHSLWGVYTDHPEDSFDDAHAAVRLQAVPETRTYVCQRVFLRQELEAYDVFTLSGWARASGLVPPTFHAGADLPVFRIRAKIVYASEPAACEEYTADFDGRDGWAYAEICFSKQKRRAVDRIEVYCEYGGSFGFASFDRICLTSRRTSIQAEENDE